jgi:hypothetical protein
MLIPRSPTLASGRLLGNLRKGLASPNRSTSLSVELPLRGWDAKASRRGEPPLGVNCEFAARSCHGREILTF